MTEGPDPIWMGPARARLRSALVSDALDALGRRDQCLSAGIAPLSTGTALVGVALPVRIEVVYEVPAVPYQGLLAALDAIGPDQVFVASVAGSPGTGGSGVAIWGELLTTVARSRGGVGAVCDGYARDTVKIRETGFPVFCRGTVPTDSNGRSEVRAHNVPVVIDGVGIEPGDLVVADDDGVVIVPAALIDTAVKAALEKDTHESRFRAAVGEGMTATEAFAKFGVL
jgi:4-hydroxy-4-methyl-2-oxoglutarate aldolase